MAFKIPEMVFETTNTAGNGTITLAGAESGFRPFSDELSNGDTTIYTVYSTSPFAYEILRGTYNANTLNPTGGHVYKSTSGDLKITWPDTSAKNVVAGLPGKLLWTILDPAETGLMKNVSGIPTTIPVTSDAEAILAAANYADMRTLLGLDIGPGAGADVQAWDADLDTLSGLLKTSGNVILGNGSAWTSAALASSLVPHVPISPYTGATVLAALNDLEYAISSSILTKTTAQTATTTEAVVTDMANLSLPGTPNSARKYRVMGQLSFTPSAVAAVNVRLYVGPNGNLTDTLVGRCLSYWSASSGYNFTVPIPCKYFTPASGNKVTISVQAETSSIAVAPLTDCWLYIEQIRPI